MATQDTRPNIILISAEQQRFDTIGSLGYDWMDTPWMDKLCEEGVAFTHAFASAATCVSSRASFYTGLYPHNTGVFTFDPWTGRQNWMHRLKDAGYQCTSIGKTHMGGDDGGFHQRLAELGNKYVPVHTGGGISRYTDWHKFLLMKGYEPPVNLHEEMPDFWDRLGAIEWPLPDECHPDFFVGDMATQWIEQCRTDHPLFLFVGFLGPHDLYDPIARYIPPYLEKDLPEPITSEEERRTQPPDLSLNLQRFEEIDNVTCIRMSHATPERIKRMRAHYCANVTMIDEKIGQIIEALDRKGMLENSVIVFTSDHGDNLGDHGLVYKGTMYDTVLRIPMIVWSPGRYEGGQQIDRVVQQMDIAPVLLELAGADMPEHLEADSLTPLLTGAPEQYGRRYAFAEEGPSSLRVAPDVLTMIRDQEWKLIHFVDREYGQLFDMQNDPDELNNLWDSPEHESVKRRLLDDLLQWMVKSRYENRNIYASHR